MGTAVAAVVAGGAVSQAATTTRHPSSPPPQPLVAMLLQLASTATHTGTAARQRPRDCGTAARATAATAAAPRPQPALPPRPRPWRGPAAPSQGAGEPHGGLRHYHRAHPGLGHRCPTPHTPRSTRSRQQPRPQRRWPQPRSLMAEAPQPAAAPTLRLASSGPAGGASLPSPAPGGRGGGRRPSAADTVSVPDKRVAVAADRCGGPRPCGGAAPPPMPPPPRRHRHAVTSYPRDRVPFVAASFGSAAH